MIFPELKEIHFDVNLHKYRDFIKGNSINDYKNAAQLEMLDDVYCLNVTLSIGEQGKEGADYFYIYVVNLNWIKNGVDKYGGILGAKLIIVDYDDVDDVERKIREIVNSIYGDSWESVLHQLRMYFNWEYENVVYYNKEL